MKEQPTYLVSSYWRGSLIIKDMRVFHSSQEVENYLQSIDSEISISSTGDRHWYRVYKMSDIAPPINVSKDFR